MAQNSAWSLTGMSTLLGRDTTAGHQAYKCRRLESEQQSAADLSRRRDKSVPVTGQICPLQQFLTEGRVLWA